MYQLLRMLTVRQILARQTPMLAISMIISEIFYKFHGFTLECLAFLATWMALDAAVQAAATLARRGGAREAEAAR